MKVKVKNIKTGAIKSIENNILSIYLATKEWEKYVEKAPKEIVEGKEKQEKKDKSSYSMENSSESK